MRVRIHPVALGAQCYVIQGEGSIVVDAGSPGQAKRLVKALERL